MAAVVYNIKMGPVKNKMAAMRNLRWRPVCIILKWAQSQKQDGGDAQFKMAGVYNIKKDGSKMAARPN